MPHGISALTGQGGRSKFDLSDRHQIASLRSIGWSVQRLAQSYDVSESTISNLLHGRTYGPTYEDLWAVLHANDVAVEDELPQAPYTQGVRSVSTLRT
jgi:transcriptional regulator with XRE-family HTH domain